MGGGASWASIPTKKAEPAVEEAPAPQESKDEIADTVSDPVEELSAPVEELSKPTIPIAKKPIVKKKKKDLSTFKPSS